MPRESIAVYNLATPADHVEGGGKYLTSANDKLIYKVRQYDAEFGASQPLPANILIPLPPEEKDDPWGGHHFQSDYLSGAPDRIVGDISTALKSLSPGGVAAAEGCFIPPERNLAYKAQALTFAVADPAAENLSTAGGAAITGVKLALSAARSGLAAAGSALQAFAERMIFSVIPRPNAQSATAAFAVEKALYGSSLSLAEYADLLGEASPTPPPPSPTPQGTDTPTTPPPQRDSVAPPPPAPTPPAQTAPEPPPQAANPTNPQPYQPGFGGGGGGSDLPGAGQGSSSQSVSSAPAVQSEIASSTEEEESAPAIIPLTVDDPSGDTTIATTSVAFSGTTGNSHVVTAAFGSTTASTTASGEGNWSLSLVLPEASTPVSFTAADGNGNTSTVVNRTITVDITAPDAPSVSIPGCSKSLSAAFCLLPTVTPLIEWGGVADAASYSIFVNDTLTTTTSEISVRPTLSNMATSTITVVAYDTAGNAATSSSIEVVGYQQAVVINEVGWAGDEVAQDRSWFELKNMTPYELDLANLRLRAVDGGEQEVALSGTLKASGYADYQYIGFYHRVDMNWNSRISRTISFGSFAETGEELRLEWSDGATTTVDATPPIAACGGWCGGAHNGKIGSNKVFKPDFYTSLSMERAAEPGDGTLAANWHTNDAYTFYYLPVAWGTPGADNSIPLPEVGTYCGSKTNVLTPAASPGPAFHPSGFCTSFFKFISYPVAVTGGLFLGDVGSSTLMELSYFINRSQYGVSRQELSIDATEGDHFFFALWDARFPDDSTAAMLHFTTGSEMPPVDYSVMPFTYKP